MTAWDVGTCDVRRGTWDVEIEGVGPMNDQWTDRLSEYLDDELSSAEVTALEAHLGACASCRATLDELRRVVARARALDDRPPATDLWPGIATGIGLAPGAHPVVSLGQRRVRRRLSFTRSEERRVGKECGSEW